MIRVKRMDLDGLCKEFARVKHVSNEMRRRNSEQSAEDKKKLPKHLLRR